MRIVLVVAGLIACTAAAARIDEACSSECTAAGYVRAFCERHCTLDEATGKLRTGGMPGGYAMPDRGAGGLAGAAAVAPRPAPPPSEASVRSEMEALRSELAALRAEVAALKGTLEELRRKGK